MHSDLLNYLMLLWGGNRLCVTFRLKKSVFINASNLNESQGSYLAFS